MAQNITLQGASYSDVPAVTLPKTGGGTASFTDVSDTTAAASDVASGKYFYTAAGVKTAGTSSGGGSDVLVVTLSYNDQTEMWEPDCTFQDIVDAYGDDKEVVFQTDPSSQNEYTPADGNYNSGSNTVYYGVFDYNTGLYCIFGMYDDGTIDFEQYDELISPNFQTVTKTYTPTTSAQTETITYNTSQYYNGLQEVNVTVNAMPTMTLPSASSTTSSGTAKATITPGSAAQYLNIPTGYNGTAQYYTIAASGGGSGMTLLKTTALGELSTSSTSSTDTGKSMTLTSTQYNDYDLLVVDVSVDTAINGRHTSTVSMVFLTGASDVNNKDGVYSVNNKWNSKLSSSGTGSTRQNSSAYGIYVSSPSINNDTLTLPFYYKYNSNYSGVINGTYTARVYGLKLYELIGG